MIPVFICDELTESMGAAPKMRLGLSVPDLRKALDGNGSRLILRRGDALGALRDLGPTPFIVALDPEDRRDLAQSMRGEAASLRENREELGTRFEALLAALRADPFDLDAVAASLGEQRQDGAQRQVIGAGLLLNHLATMSVAERAAYADRLDRSLRRGAKR